MSCGMPDNEADTCRKYIVPKLQAAGWEKEPREIAEQRYITPGRIIPVGRKHLRKPGRKVDYILRYRRDFPLAVVEAKARYKTAEAGVQQAKDYAERLKVKFAYASNGREIIEIDLTKGTERPIDEFPTPEELWKRYCTFHEIGSDVVEEQVLTPFHFLATREARYYQEAAINLAVQSIITGDLRALLTLATGAGKSFIAFQICWKLAHGGWNRRGDGKRPRILYLADRNVLVDKPKDDEFLPFGDARWKIEGGAANLAREMYFAIYQALCGDATRPALYEKYPRDFFDLIIVDECHRGSAKARGHWRGILDYFQPAAKLGMTATPKRDDNTDTYAYFGNPIYTYPLRQGIDDGFLAPYCLHRVVTSYDAAGWRPSKNEVDRYGRPIPDDEYQTPDFERTVALRARTEAIAQHLTHFLKSTDRFGKTIIFCVDQEHASEMRRALINRNSDLVKLDKDYVVRITDEEKEIGKGHLDRLSDVESDSPIIATTSQMLSTGIDVQTCKNVVLVRVVNSMNEFKQIIGRGTRVREDRGKAWFNIIDYAGSANRKFADPDFDGEPELLTQEQMDDEGNVIEPPEPTSEETSTDTEESEPQPIDGPEITVEPPGAEPRKFYVDNGVVEVIAHIVHQIDADGTKLAPITITDYTAEKVRTLYLTDKNLAALWAQSGTREQVTGDLASRGIDFDQLREITKMPDADPLDILAHLAFKAPPLSRRQRAERLKKSEVAFLEKFTPEARVILSEILDKYAEHGPEQFKLPDVLALRPISDHGNLSAIISVFGSADELREAVEELQSKLYAA